MPSHYSKTRKRWVYEFERVVDGRRHRACKLLPKEWGAAEASAYGSKKDAELFAAAAGIRQHWLIAEAVHAYLQHQAGRLKNEAKLIRDLAITQPWYTGKRIDELPEVVAAYCQDNQGLAPATVRNRMAYLRSACRWAWKHRGMGQHDPGERVALPVARNERHHYIGRAEVLRLARRLADRDQRACVLIAFYSGMRLAEVLRAQPTTDGWLLTDTKNGDRRIVPIHPRVAHLARRWPRGVKASTLQHNFRRIADGLGLAELRFHDLRHSTASALLAAGVDLYTIGRVLGHKAVASTARYTHLAVEPLKKAIGSL